MASPKRAADFADVGYFANWSDLWFPRLANWLLEPAARLRWLTPNLVTTSSLVFSALGAVLVIAGRPGYVWAAASFVVSYILDCLDGQLARYTQRFSPIGSYLDKTFDTFRIGLIAGTFGYEAAHSTGQGVYWMLALIIIFAFMNRYYIKYVTMFEALAKDPHYLETSRTARAEATAALDRQKAGRQTLSDHLRWLWVRNRSLFMLEEAEFITFGALALITGQLALWLWTFAILQSAILLQRLVTRAYQLKTNFAALYRPLPK